MDTGNLYKKIAKELQRNLSVTELYDFDRNKERIRIVLLPVKSNRALLEELPHLLFHNGKYAGVFSLELFCDNGFNISHYVTHVHLQLWRKNTDDLYRLITGID